jgi:hypothetical protein
VSALRAAGRAGVAAASPAIGILSAEQVFANADAIRYLPYQHDGASCGFLPDSNEASRDMRNVREGRYPAFGPLHFFTAASTTGEPRNASVAAFARIVQGITAVPGLDLISFYAQNRLVPQCAMRVERRAEGTNVVALRPEVPCGCAYELAATGMTACQTCTRAAECPASAPNCVLEGTPARGYCEP